MPFEDISLDFDCLYEELQAFSEQLTAEYDQVVDNIFIERGDCLIEAYTVNNPEITQMIFACYLPEYITQEKRAEILESTTDSVYYITFFENPIQVLSANTGDYSNGLHAATHIYDIDGEKKEERGKMFSELIDLFNIDFDSFEDNYAITELENLSTNQLISAIDSILERNPQLRCSIKTPHIKEGISFELRSHPKIKNGAWQASYILKGREEVDIEPRIDYIISQLESAGIDFYEKDWRLTDKVSNRIEPRSVTEHISQGVTLYDTIASAYDDICKDTFNDPYYLIGKNGSVTTRSSFEKTFMITSHPESNRVVSNGPDKYVTRFSGDLWDISTEEGFYLFDTYGYDDSLKLDIVGNHYHTEIEVSSVKDRKNIRFHPGMYNTDNCDVRILKPILNALSIDYTLENNTITGEQFQTVSSINLTSLISSVEEAIHKDNNLNVKIKSMNGLNGFEVKKRFNREKNAVKNEFELSGIFYDKNGKNEVAKKVITDLESIGVDFTGKWTFTGEKK